MAKRTASAKKQARAGVRRAARNRGVKSEVKTLVVKARKSMVGSPVAESERYAVTLEAVRALDRAASKGILHRNNAARRKARLTKLMAKVAITAPAAAGAAGKGKKGAVAASAAPVPAKPASRPAASKKK
ncbi:MAG TPA: 30S ribosomal protein S20 [Candidatus Dormibacteraeota bacterium]|nr:30S ribosomal protein S20 [Candidatus Dormibacteraeota bacterium]